MTHSSQSLATLYSIGGTECAGVGGEAVGAVSGLAVGTMVGFHAATDFGDLAIGKAACWHPVTHQDGDKEKTTRAQRRHLQNTVSATTRCPQSLKRKRHHAFLHRMNSTMITSKISGLIYKLFLCI